MVTVYSYLIKFLNLIHPKLSAKLVHHLLSNPQIQKERQRESVVLDKAEQLVLDFEGFQVQGYAWGPETGKPLFLVHGWEGHTGNLGALVEPLIHKGFRVYGYDAPAHGRSSRGRTHMFQYAQFLQGMIGKLKPGVIISHSFGTTSAVLALRALKNYSLDHLIMIGSPYTFNSRIETVRKQYNIPVRIMTALRPIIEDRSGERIEALNFDHYAEFLKSVNHFSLYHSRSDTVVPYHYAKDILKALPGSRLYTLDGLGHFGTLWAQELLDLIDKQLPDLHNRSL